VDISCCLLYSKHTQIYDAGLLQIILLIAFLLITPIFVFFIYDFFTIIFQKYKAHIPEEEHYMEKDLPPNIKALAKKMNVKVKNSAYKKDCIMPMQRIIKQLF